jgi:peroxiredoxin Q/BCP
MNNSPLIAMVLLMSLAAMGSGCTSSTTQSHETNLTNGAPTAMALIDIGKKAPAFKRIDQHGKTHQLSDYAGQYLVIYFYPKNDTPGCTTEACEFRDLTAEFAKRSVAVLGVSPDDEDSHARFTEKYELNFPLLADPPNKQGTPAMCAKYGVWQERNMYGNIGMGIVRTTYLIGPDGKVAHRWDRVRAAGHAEAVLSHIDGL